MCRVGNLKHAIDALQKRGFWSVGAANDAEAKPIGEFEFPERCALILGSEERGVREKLYEKTDSRVRIPLVPGVDSLNVSVAAGILAYAWHSAFGKDA